MVLPLWKSAANENGRKATSPSEETDITGIKQSDAKTAPTLHAKVSSWEQHTQILA